MLTYLVNVYQVTFIRKSNNFTVLIEVVLVNIFLLSDDSHDYSNNMSEKVDIVEVKTEPNESDELFSVCKITNRVDNYSKNDKTTSESINHIFFILH